jgi:hypothetical protein
MFPKDSNIEGLFPNATVFSGGDLGTFLDHEHSNFINGLIHWLIYVLMGFREVLEGGA